MENYTITTERINELCKESYFAKLMLPKWFPEAFKKELEVGKWYKRPHNSALFYVTEILNIDSNHCKVFGFDNVGKWMPENAKTFPDNDFEATPEQIESALINEAKKRGFKNGAIGNNSNPNECNLINNKLNFIGMEFDDKTNELRAINNVSSFWTVFKYGKWAEIIPEETKVITMDKAVKILSKKYGKQVEIK